jgi:hypothetical protein
MFVPVQGTPVAWADGAAPALSASVANTARTPGDLILTFMCCSFDGWLDAHDARCA